MRRKHTHGITRNRGISYASSGPYVPFDDITYGMALGWLPGYIADFIFAIVTVVTGFAQSKEARP